jgi:hypothetical protein
MILSFLFFAFVAYLVYKLIVDFVLPIYKTTRNVKRKFREMNEQMNARKNHQGSQNGQHKNNAQGQKTTIGDYIDFEEVKD